MLYSRSIPLRHGTLISFVLVAPALAAEVAVVPKPRDAVSGLNPAASPSISQALATPNYSSDPSAPYTLYLDFGGFTYTGNWGGGTPGTTPAYDNDGNTASFSSGEAANIHNIWSRIAQKYLPFNINVTTVDPALAAGRAATDSDRQTYYDTTARVMHTVIGGSGSWTGGGGVSYVGTTPYAYSGNGYHTNWVFAAQAPNNLQFVSEATAHEDGHGLGLNHQNDYNGSTLVSEYSDGTGAVAPIMGVSYYASRGGLWSKGTVGSGSTTPVIQNDAYRIANDPGMNGFREDHVGHTFATATRLPISSNAIDYTTAKGVIVPTSLSDPMPLGSANYTADHWSFVTIGGLISLKVNSGITTFGTSTADPSPTLDASLALYNASGSLVQLLDTTSLTETLTTTLTAGIYDLAVLSHGGLSDTTYTQRDFFDMGSYYLSGSIRTPVAGDVNLDNKVDIADLGLLAQHWQQAGVFTDGDFDGNNFIDIADLGLLAQHWQYGVTGGGMSYAEALALIETQFDVSVPEPGTAALVIGCSMIMNRRRKTRS